MGDPRGFLKVRNRGPSYRPVCERLNDYGEVAVPRSDDQSVEQASRCMDCGTPFCHWGCPIGNYIPEWNDLMFNGHWEEAANLLEATNNMPEITGRVCPAICEHACVLGINDDPVTIRENELAIIEQAFKAGLIRPSPPEHRTGKKVAVVGSGPAGLACAARLNRAGHEVVVFEKSDRIGGMLRYGIPDFKLEKWVIDRRADIWKKEGIEFKTGVDVGADYRTEDLLKRFDAVCLAGGCGTPRDLPVEGRHLKGIHFALDYLVQSNRRVAGEKIPLSLTIDAQGKKVVILGGGDTGADCLGVAHRQGAGHVTQVELLPRPPECRTENYPWPSFPTILKTSSSHEEGGKREWSVMTEKFIGKNGQVKKLSCVRMSSLSNGAGGRLETRPVPGSEFEIEADLVILALGFVHPRKKGLLESLNPELDQRGNVKTDRNYMTSIRGVFSAGDIRRGQSLVAWAVAEGRSAAGSIDRYLMGSTVLRG